MKFFKVIHHYLYLEIKRNLEIIPKYSGDIKNIRERLLWKKKTLVFDSSYGERKNDTEKDLSRIRVLYFGISYMNRLKKIYVSAL